MVEEQDLKQWRDAGHVARRTLEGIKGEIVEGKEWSEVIDSAERFIRRHGGKAAFPVTISVNEMAAHYTSNTELTPPEGFEGEMVFQKGDLVKLDVGVHIKGAIADNALTVEVGSAGNHTDQIKAAKEARDAAIEMMHPGTPWHEIGAAAEQVSKDAGFRHCFFWHCCLKKRFLTDGLFCCKLVTKLNLFLSVTFANGTYVVRKHGKGTPLM